MRAERPPRKKKTNLYYVNMYCLMCNMITRHKSHGYKGRAERIECIRCGFKTDH